MLDGGHQAYQEQGPGWNDGVLVDGNLLELFHVHDLSARGRN